MNRDHTVHVLVVIGVVLLTIGLYLQSWLLIFLSGMTIGVPLTLDLTESEAATVEG